VGLREEFPRVHIGSVALEDSVGQEHEPVSGLQLQFLDPISASTAIPNGKPGAKSTSSAWPSRIRIGKGWPAFTILAIPQA